MSRASNHRSDGKMSLKSLGYDKKALSLDLAKYLTEDVLVKRTELKRINRGTLFDVYRLALGYRRERDSVLDTESLVAKVFTGNGASTDYSGFFDQRKDLLEYEATVAMYMSDYAPKYFSHNKDILIMEDLGGNTLEGILLNMSLDSNDLQKLLNNLVTRLAGFHDELDVVIENNKFKRMPTFPNYVDKFDLYISEIWEDRYGGDRPLNRNERRIIREAFAPLADILENGTITGEALSNRPIHQNCHPANIFYKIKDENLNAFFIDYMPRRGPSQFDLVDCLVNPLVYSYLKNGEEAIEILMSRYMTEMVTKVNRRLGNRIENGVHLTEGVINDSKGVNAVSRLYRDFRAASKGCSIRRKRPDVYEQYVARNRLYPDFQTWYVADGIETSYNLAFNNGSKYGLKDDQLRSTERLMAILTRLFSSDVDKKYIIAKKLDIKEENSVDIISTYVMNTKEELAG